MAQEFPEVQGGGSMIVAWQVRDKNVLVVGGGEVSFNPTIYIYINISSHPAPILTDTKR